MAGRLSILATRFASFVLAACLVFAAELGCSDQTIHVDKLQSAFQSTPPETRAQLDIAVADINANNFAAALPVLQKVAFSTRMSKEQREILEDTVRKVRTKAGQK